MAADNVITYLLELEDKVSAELKKTSKNVEGLEGELKKLKEEQKKGAAADDRRAQSMGALKVGFAATAVAVAATAAAFGAMAKHAISTSANLEAFETRLGGLLGGLDQGKARVQELFEISAKTPFSITGLVEAETTLEAFGVNAPKVRQGVMDLAGAMGMDLNEAARGVGKALAAGAGAADVLREKGVIAMIEVQAGVAATEMSLQEFREALVETLEESEKLAGGTQRMALTFDGLMSTLKDQFTVFSKQVGDAQLFATAKAAMVVILEVLGDSTAETEKLAGAVGGGLSANLIFVMETTGEIAIRINRLRASWLSVKTLVLDIHVAMIRFVQSIDEGIAALAELHLVDERAADGAKDYSKLLAVIEHEQGLINDAAKDVYDTEEQIASKTVEIIARTKELAAQYQAAATASKSIKPPAGSDEIMTMVGIDKESAGKAAKASKDAAKTAKEAAKATASFVKQMDSLRSNFAKTAAATRKPLKESKQLQESLKSMSADMQKAALTSIDLGDEAMVAFTKVKDGMIASMSEIAAAIPKARRAEAMAAAGAGMEAGVDIMETGGLGMLGGAGPAGAGAAGLIGVGQQGQAAYQEEVNLAAQATADARAEKMQAEAEAMKEKGYSEDEIAAAGLGAEAIETAGQVTPADEALAEAATDRDSVMAQMVTDVIQGVIDGVMAIMQGLPEILSALIPMLLVDLPTALIESIPTLIEELIPVLLFELPKAIILMLVKVVPRLLKMLFMDLPQALFNGIAKWWSKVWGAITDFFSLGFQTGGYVPKTSSYLLHQGERVVPASGAGTGTASKGLGAFTQGSTNLTVNTHVVDPDSLVRLSQMVSDEVGPHGRTTVPIWGTTSPVTSI